MKKTLFLVFIIFNLYIVGLRKEITESTYVINDNMFDIYKLSTNLNTKNILNYITEEIDIIAIFPKIKNNYNSELKKYVYSFTLTTNQNNINLFTNQYRNLLIENNYYREANLISFDGIYIDKIIIYTNPNSVNKLINTGKFSL